MGIQRVFYMSDGLYTKADLYRGNELVETIENHSSVRVASILINNRSSDLKRHQPFGYSIRFVLKLVQFHATATFDEFIRDSFRVNNHEI